MRKSVISLLFIAFFITGNVHGQPRIAGIDTLLTGTWKGTSICQVKNSPCHDENVVYHISKNAATDSFLVDAVKIVNGDELEMGILPFYYKHTTNQFVSSAYGNWTFIIEPGKLDGTLVFRGELYRKIKLYKQY